MKIELINVTAGALSSDLVLHESLTDPNRVILSESFG